MTSKILLFSYILHESRLCDGRPVVSCCFHPSSPGRSQTTVPPSVLIHTALPLITDGYLESARSLPSVSVAPALSNVCLLSLDRLPWTPASWTGVDVSELFVDWSWTE